MKDFYFKEEGEFSISQFEEKIAEAKRFLANKYEVSESEIKAVRHSQDIGISDGSRATGSRATFPAYVIGYEIIKDEKVVGHLEGHLSKALDYIHIFSN